MVKTILPLCGLGSSGKTRTLKKFFGIPFTQRLRPMKLLKRIVNGKTIYAVSLSSPQEQTRFQSVKQIIEDIKKRIKKCEDDANGQDYILIIPFTIRRIGRRLNENQIKDPIEWLKGQNYRVYPIYLRKMSDVDLLMDEISEKEIKSVKDGEPNQARNLEELIKTL